MYTHVKPIILTLLSMQITPQEEKFTSIRLTLCYNLEFNNELDFEKINSFEYTDTMGSCSKFNRKCSLNSNKGDGTSS